MSTAGPKCSLFKSARADAPVKGHHVTVVLAHVVVGIHGTAVSSTYEILIRE
jgi:hypothetical protein